MPKYRAYMGFTTEVERFDNLEQARKDVEKWATGIADANELYIEDIEVMEVGERGYKEPTYKVIRFFRDPDKDNYVVLDGLTLEEAQAHCSREDTHDTEAGWFDGYEEERDND